MALVSGRVFYLQRSHFLQAEGYLKDGNQKLALREYDTAMHFYLPFSPYIERSAERLWQMGEAFEKEGRHEWAHSAYSSIRSSFYASRWLFTPGRDWIEKCDEKIADLNIRMLLAEGIITEADAPAERKKHIELLKTDRAPRPFFAFLSAVSFAGWVASALYAAFRGFEASGAMRKKPLIGATIGFAFFFLLWAVALLKA